MNTTEDNSLENVLNKLHEEAKNDFTKIGQRMTKVAMSSLQPIEFEYAYLPVSRQQGQFLRRLIVSNNFKQVVEFGTSFGISTIYLADAVRQTDGKVVTTELIESKAKKALQNIREANLCKYVEVKIGDALQTLKDYNTTIDFLFLDGWKNLYLPLFQMLEPLFYNGTMIYADNMNMEDTKPYAKYILANRTNYSTQSVDNGKGFLTRVL